MDGTQIRKAREAARLGQVLFASSAGIARSGLQHLEATGNGTIALLERVIAALPNLHTITLGGREFVALDRPAAERAVTRLVDDVRQLAEIFQIAGAPAGATRHDAAGVDDETRARATRLEDAIARGAVPPEDDS